MGQNLNRSPLFPARPLVSSGWVTIEMLVIPACFTASISVRKCAERHPLVGAQIDHLLRRDRRPAGAASAAGRGCSPACRPERPAHRGRWSPPVRCSVISFTVRVFGTATSMPDCSTGAVIMKITSSTSTTSTSGVMLISAREDRVWPARCESHLFNPSACHVLRRQRRRRCAPAVATCKCRAQPRARARCAALRRPARTGNLLERIQQLAAKIVCCRGKNPNPRRELVVGHHRRHSHKQACRRRDQRFGNARRHGAQRCRSRRAQPVKRIHNAHYRSEQARQTGWWRQSSPATSCGVPGWSSIRWPPSAPSAPAASCCAAAPIRPSAACRSRRPPQTPAPAGLPCSRPPSAEISCSRVALRNARINLRLSLVALPNVAHLAENHGPRIETRDQQQHQHADAQPDRCCCIMSISALEPALPEGPAGRRRCQPAMRRAKAAVRIGIHLNLHGIRRDTPSKLSIWSLSRSDACFERLRSIARSCYAALGTRLRLEPYCLCDIANHLDAPGCRF